MTTCDTNRDTLILVVDDEPEVRRFVRTILERSGYTVKEAVSAEAALEFLHTHAPAPDLLLTDIVMPGMNGIALAGQAHRLLPGLHVLFMSGFSQDYSADLTGTICLSKPFKAAEMLAAIQSVITGGPARSGHGGAPPHERSAG